jgi:glycosyltransferase involved in cell wall biosynthesis
MDVEASREAPPLGQTAPADQNRLRVCFVSSEYPPQVGGLGKSAHRIAGRLARAGIDVHVFTPSRASEEKGGAPPLEGVTVHEVEPRMLLPVSPVRGLTPWLSARPIGFPRRAPQLRAAIAAVAAERPFDIFHGFGLWVSVPCLEAARQFGRPSVLSIRGADGLAMQSTPSWVAALRSASWVTSVSKDSLDRAARLADTGARSSFVPNGIDQETFPAPGVASWKPDASNAGVVGTVAAFRVKKNLPLLIDAYARLPRTTRKRLLLVGDLVNKWASNERQRAGFQDYILERGLSQEVEMTGFVPSDRVADYLQSMRVFALSSDHEGLPNSVLEAAAAGVPIVSTAVDGVKDVFVDGESALLVPTRDPDAMSRALARVLGDDELSLSLSRAGRDVASRLTVEAECKAYVDLYESLLRDAHASRA